MGIRLNRRLDRQYAHLDAGEWQRVDVPHEGERVFFTCPLCGEEHEHDAATHVVDRGGQMTPAFRCGKCPLVEWLEFEAWNEEATP